MSRERGEYHASSAWQASVPSGPHTNRRVQVFDSDGTFKRQFLNVGTPTAICITPGTPQSLYIAHTGDPDGMEDAAIYRKLQCSDRAEAVATGRDLSLLRT